MYGRLMKWSVALCAVFVVAASLAAGAEIEARDLVAGHNSPETSPIHTGLVKFKDLVEERTGGKVTVQIFSNAQLGSEEEMAEGIRSGTQDLAYLAVGNVATFAPNFQIFTMPYLFNDYGHLQRALDGGLADILVREAREKGGIKVFKTFWMDGERHYFNSKRPVNSPDDLKGMKLRVPEWRPIIRVTEAFGANPIIMSFGDMYIATSNGTIDGFEATPVTAVNNKFSEIVKHMCLDCHAILPATLCMNPAVFDSMSPALQQIIEDCAKEAGEFQINQIISQSVTALDTLRSQGIAITEVDKAPFVEKAKGIYGEFNKIIDPELIKLVQSIK